MRMHTFWRQGRCPYRYDGSCMVLRKSVFMQRNGYLKNLAFLRGEYDFTVNDTAPERTANVIVSPCLLQEEPSSKSWKNRQLFYMQHRSHLRRTFMHRLRFSLQQILLHAVYWALLGAVVYASLQQQPVFIAATAVLLLLVLTVHTLLLSRLTKRYGEHISWWKLAGLDLGQAWHYSYFWLRYKMTDKYDFVRK